MNDITAYSENFTHSYTVMSMDWNISSVNIISAHLHPTNKTEFHWATIKSKLLLIHFARNPVKSH